jgi:pimeloyl-ACP methyl ester carboxylesterase
MDPQIVLMPGLDGTGRLFDWVLPHLPVDPAPILVRYPTQDPLGYAELEPLVLERVRDRGPFVLVAESFSGPLAVRLAVRHDLPLRGLVFAGSFVANPFRFLRPWTGPLLQQWMFSLQTRPMIRAMLTGRDGPEDVVDGVASAMSMVDTAVSLHRAREVVAADEWGRFANLRVPMAYLFPTRDRMIPAAHPERMAARRPELDLVRIEAPHLVLQCAPAEAARAILERARGWADGAA